MGSRHLRPAVAVIPSMEVEEPRGTSRQYRVSARALFYQYQAPSAVLHPFLLSSSFSQIFIYLNTVYTAFLIMYVYEFYHHGMFLPIRLIPTCAPTAALYVATQGTHCTGQI